MHVSQLVRGEVRARFAESDVDDVHRLFEAVDLGRGSDARGHDRVQLAVLKQAGGSFERFARYLALAITDWRDLLVGAGLADDDWREVLQRDGFAAPE